MLLCGEMVKRKWVDDHQSRCASAKRTRCGTKSKLLDLSDELILRILSFLPVSDLARCEILNRKVKPLSTDGELWREKFYTNFVRRRAKRLPGLRLMDSTDRNRNALFYASRTAKWLQYTELNKPGTNWKRAYKVRSNWTRGIAKTSETTVASCDESPLARICGGKIFTVDKQHGLRSWHREKLLCSNDLGHSSLPTSTAICARKGDFIVVVGFADGNMSVFSSTHSGVLSYVGNVTLDTETAVSAVAVSWPYLLSMTSDRSISLYLLSSETVSGKQTASSNLLIRLRSDAEYGPIALSLRQTKSSIIASIAYTFQRFNTGWCLGLQELKMSHDGYLLNNRMTPPVDDLPSTFRRPFIQNRWDSSNCDFISRAASSEPFVLHPHVAKQPTSLSCSGCYVLAGLPDNTLMVYTVESTDESLSISTGRRLWGHTSAVAATEVTSTGKALSISAKSNEMRYWELEEIVSSQTARTSTPIKSWTSINSALAARGNGLGIALYDLKRETELTRKWVGFDDEHAVILGKRGSRQVLSCFDFA